MIEIGYELGKEFTNTHVCAVCGGLLELPWGGSYGIENYVLGCGQDKEHQGIVKKQTYTSLHRQGKEIYPTIRDNIQRKMLPGGVSPGVALAMVQARYPSVELDDPTAALFIWDCIRLDLDPLLGEVVPAVFTNKKTGRKIVTPIITEEGSLSMAARACPETWNGPPTTMTLEERFYSKYPKMPAAKITELITETKTSLCSDPKAHVWVAFGRAKGMTEDREAYGWVTAAQINEARNYSLPWAQLPGNQARVRAVKRWAKLVYPEAKANMRELTSDLIKRAGDFQEVQHIIEAEYQIAESEGGEAGKKPTDKPKVNDVTAATAEKGKGAGQAGDEVASGTKGEKAKKSADAAPAAGGADSVTEADIPDLTTLAKLCFQFFNLQPPDVWKELGYRSMLDVTEPPWDCWLKIKEIKSGR